MSGEAGRPGAGQVAGAAQGASPRNPGPIRSFRDLLAWQKAYALADLVYDMADTLPDYEKFSLGSQVRRASTSVYGNIAEGYGIGTRPSFLKHLHIARGSFSELDAHLGFIRKRRSANIPDSLDRLVAETGRLLQGLIGSLERSLRPGPSAKPKKKA